ncbi:MAG: PilZ domain-containing protein [Vicinamibacterales bacterium]
MSRSESSAPTFASARLASDHLAASAQQALAHWRSTFDQKLDALEQALQQPSGDLTALIVDFARVAGEEAEAAARHATLDAQARAAHAVDEAARHAAEQAAADAEQQAASARADRQALNDTRRALDETSERLSAAERVRDELRQAIDGTRRAAEESRQALEEARRQAAEARAYATQSDEERRELLGVQAQLMKQLEDARAEVRDVESHARALGEQLEETSRAAEVQARDLQTFRRRLEQAVRDAEQRSRAQEEAHARLEQASREAEERARRAAAERDGVRDECARLTRDVEGLRTQLREASVRLRTLEGDVQGRDRAIAELKAMRPHVRREAATPPLPVFSDPATTLALAPSARRDAAVPTIAAEPSSPIGPLVLAPIVATPEPAKPATSAAVVPAYEPRTPPPLPLATDAIAVSASVLDRSEGLPESAEQSDARDAEPVSGAPPRDAVKPEILVDAPPDDPPLSPDSTGVFSTVADALRAWTTEPVSAAAPSSASEGTSPAPSDGNGTESTSPERPRVSPSKWDVVRQSARYDLSPRRISVTIDQEVGQLVDLSVEGAQVVTSMMLKPGRHVRMSFPTAGPLANAKAKIVWSRLEPPTMGGGELQYRAGLTFIKIEPKIIDRVLHAPETPKREPRRSTK